MASGRKEYRNFLLCSGCMRLQSTLPGHLRRVCQKGADETEIKRSVREARDRMRSMVTTLSCVSYKSLNWRKSDFSEPQEFFADFLEKQGCAIIDKPYRRNPDEEPSEDEASWDSDGGDSFTDEVRAARRMKLTLSLRKKLTKAGLHGKHDLDSPLLDTFNQYLAKEFTKLTRKSMLDNVARFLYFMNPNDVSVDFLKDVNKTKRFVSTHLRLKTSQATVRNYVNHIQTFLKFVVSDDFPWDLDEDMKRAAGAFKRGLGDIIMKMNHEGSKGKKRKYRGNKWSRSLQRKNLSPSACRRVLTTAAPHVETYTTRANSGAELDDTEKSLTCYYLQALLILKHLCKPSIPQNLTVREWLQRSFSTSSDGLQVSILKTAQNTIVLQQEEEQLFDIYFTAIRPALVEKNTRAMGNFFVSLRGQPIKNSCKDVQRLHEKYQLPSVTWKQANSAVNNWAQVSLSQQDRDAVSSYVDRGGPKEADKNLQIHGMFILARLGSNDGAESPSSPVMKKRKTTKEEEEEEEEEEEDGTDAAELVDLKEDCFKRLLSIYPIGLNLRPPSLYMCRGVNESAAQYCQDKWRRGQYQARIDEIIADFRRVPSEEQLLAYVGRQAWTTNVPKLQHVLEAWRPQEPRRREDPETVVTRPPAPPPSGASDRRHEQRSDRDHSDQCDHKQSD